jgi:hypothetical protein
MALAKKALGGWLLAKFFTSRRLPWYRRHTAARTSPAALLLSLTPLGRFSLGGLAFIAARRVLANRRLARA